MKAALLGKFNAYLWKNASPYSIQGDTRSLLGHFCSQFGSQITLEGFSYLVGIQNSSVKKVFSEITSSLVITPKELADYMYGLLRGHVTLESVKSSVTNNSKATSQMFFYDHLKEPRSQMISIQLEQSSNGGSGGEQQMSKSLSNASAVTLIQKRASSKVPSMSQSSFKIAAS